MDVSIALDALPYIKLIAPLLMLIGAISFADLTTNFLVNLFKQLKVKGMKW